MPANDATDGQLFDVRTVKWYIGRGKVDSKEYERYLRSLPDAADKAEPIDASEPGGRRGRGSPTGGRTG